MNGVVVEDDWVVDPSDSYKQVGCKCSSVDLNRCVIDGNRTGLVVAARTTKTAGCAVARLRSCTVANSSILGLDIQGYGLAELVDCQITGSEISLQCTKFGKVCLQKCTVSKSEIGIKMWGGGNMLLSQCTFHENIQEAEITDADTIVFDESL